MSGEQQVERTIADEWAWNAVANWGWVRQQGRSPVELPLMMRSLRLWQELPRDPGEDIGFTQGRSISADVRVFQNGRRVGRLDIEWDDAQRNAVARLSGTIGDSRLEARRIAP